MSDIFGDDGPKKPGAESDFAALFESSQAKLGQNLRVGDKIDSEILSIGKEEVFVSTGTVQDGMVLRKDLLDDDGQFLHSVGDHLSLYVTYVKGTDVKLSPKATAKNLAEDLEDAWDKMLPVEGRVTELTNGGFRVQLMGKSAFCPISQMDIKYVEQPEEYLNKKFEFLITQFSERGRNIVVSRRKLLEELKEVAGMDFFETKKPGMILSGMITRLEKYGAFVDLGDGVEGLCHISEIAWSRISDPNEVLTVGQAVKVKILNIEQGAKDLRISLSIKQVEEAPWEKLSSEIQEGSVVDGRVTRLMKFGAFVEIMPGVEGLLPLQEMSYVKRVMKPEDAVQENEKIRVMIKEINMADRKLLLSLRDAGSDPWAMVMSKFPVGAVVPGLITRKENYGVFVELEPGIVGLLPRSHLQDSPDFQLDKLKVGMNLTIKVSEIQYEERKLNLTLPTGNEDESWKGFQGGAGSGSFGSLGDQLQGLFNVSSTPKSKG